MRHPEVQELLQPYGFSTEIQAEGWRCLMQLAEPGGKARRVTGFRPEADIRLEELIATWVPVMRAVLRAHFGDRAGPYLEGVRVGRGRRAVMVTQVMLRRLEAMKEGKGPFEAEGREVRELLSKHGLDCAIESEIRKALERVWSPEEGPLVRTRAQDDAAIAELWTWYLKWSHIARSVVKKPALLRALGLSAEQPQPQKKTGKTKARPTSVRVVREISLPSDDFSQRLPGKAETDQ